MKRAIQAFLLALLLAFEANAATGLRPRFRRARSHRPTHRVYRTTKASRRLPKVRPVPWQTIAAVGAATSGIVFAYKVSDGIQQGTIEFARSKPDAFPESIGVPVAVSILVIMLIAIACTLWRYDYRHKAQSPPGDSLDSSQGANKPPS